MSDVVINRPGTPIITKVANALNKEVTNLKVAINCVRRAYDACEKSKSYHIKVEEKDLPVVTADQIKQEMNRGIID